MGFNSAFKGLIVIANVKQLRTGGSFRILLPFFRTCWGDGVLNSAIFNSFHNRVEFGTILEGLRNFGRGVLNLPTPPPRYVTALRCMGCATTVALIVTSELGGVKLRPFYTKGNRRRYPMNRRLGGPQRRSGRFGQEKYLSPAGNRTTTTRLLSP